MQVWYESRFFKYAVGILLVLLIIFMMYQTAFLFNPIINFFAALFFPILFAGILYYLLRPLVRRLEKLRIPRVVAIAIAYVITVIFFILIIVHVVPILVEQVNALTSAPAEKIEAVKEKTVDVMRYLHLDTISGPEIRNTIIGYLKKIYELITENIGSTIASITRFALWLIITPFILFYLLRDDESADSLWMRVVPKKYHEQAGELFSDIDNVLSSFFTGQLLVAASLGLLIFIGYLIIGLQNAVILALFATVCMTIPIFGTFLALIPALLVGMAESPWMGLKVILVVMVAQILESNFISPQIMAKRMNIHPLILMLILLASGLLYGILGLFLATPVYAVVRVIATHAYAFYKEKSA